MSEFMEAYHSKELSCLYIEGREKEMNIRKEGKGSGSEKTREEGCKNY